MPIAPVSLELSGVDVVLRFDVLLRLADFLAPDERFERFALELRLDAARVPLFAFELLLFDAELRDFEREPALLRDELAFDRPALRDRVLFPPRPRVAAAFTLPRLPRDFVLRLLLPLRDVLLLRARPRLDLPLPPVSPIMPPADPPCAVLSSISSIPVSLLRAMAPVS